MGLFTPAEVTANYAAAGRGKTTAPAWRLLLLGVLAGLLIAMGGAVASTATHAVDNAGLARVLSGLLFPFALATVILTGAELFTGNCLLVIPALDRQATWSGVLRNWLLVYLGNAAGAVLTAAGCAFSGQLGLGGGALAVHTIKTAAAKCALPFENALVLGIFCNVLVTLAVVLSLSAKDVPGRIMGAFLPVCFFVICGFEHCVANLFYVPAGLFAQSVPAYAALAAQAGVDASGLTWGAFLTGNLLPVTLGNILGGAGVGGLLWACHLRRSKVSAPR